LLSCFFAKKHILAHEVTTMTLQMTFIVNVSQIYVESSS